MKMGMRLAAHRIKFVATLASIAAVYAATALMAQKAGTPTHTELIKAVQQVAGRDVITYAATVISDDGTPAKGAVSLMEGDRSLASAAIDSTGKAEIRYDGLSSADHALRAVYNGDPTHQASQSESMIVHPEAAASPDFTLAINVPGGTNATTMTVDAPGDSGSLVATVTPATGFTGFISLSLSGPPASSGSPGGTSLPVGVTYTFTPANLQIALPTTANPTGAASADMALVTAVGQETTAQNSNGRAPLALAILLPGIVGLGYFGRKRKLFAGVAMMALLASITLLGATGCAARYRYLHHGPTFGGTPAGTYTLTVTAQTSNGVTASSQSQTLTLIVK